MKTMPAVRIDRTKTLARNALLNMIDHLAERGWTPQQGYAIRNVAADLKIS
jgi:formamidase